MVVEIFQGKEHLGKQKSGASFLLKEFVKISTQFWNAGGYRRDILT